MKKFTKKFFAGWQILVLLIPMLWQFGFSISTIHAEGATERTNHIEITPTGRTTPTASGTTDKAKFSFSSPLLDNGQMTRILNANNTTATANDGKTASLLVREKLIGILPISLLVTVVPSKLLVSDTIISIRLLQATKTNRHIW